MLKIIEKYKKEVTEITFQCKCGCRLFHRPAGTECCTTYLEGHFNCSRCLFEFNYYSDELTARKLETVKPQLELF